MARDYVTIVSGMPRSGTSLMMRMLQAGGIPVLDDARRPADEHNPRGYFEDARVRRLAQDASWLDEARGKAVKIIYRLLPHLPPSIEYRVLFMHRDLEEVFDSQRDMLLAAKEPAAEQDRERLLRALAADLETVRRWATQQPNILQWDVPYAELVSTPAPWVTRISAFLDGGFDEAAMIAAVEPSLYRHRK